METGVFLPAIGPNPPARCVAMFQPRGCRKRRKRNARIQKCVGNRCSTLVRAFRSSISRPQRTLDKLKLLANSCLDEGGASDFSLLEFALRHRGGVLPVLQTPLDLHSIVKWFQEVPMPASAASAPDRTILPMRRTSAARLELVSRKHLGPGICRIHRGDTPPRQICALLRLAIPLKNSRCVTPHGLHLDAAPR